MPSLCKLCKGMLYRMTTELVVTNNRRVAKVGCIKRRTAELNLPKVESINVHQNILDRILDSGTIIFNGSVIEATPIPNIDGPLRFRLNAMEAIDEYYRNK